MAKADPQNFRDGAMPDDGRWVFNKERNSIYDRKTDFEVMILGGGHPDRPDVVIVSRGDILKDGKKFVAIYNSATSSYNSTSRLFEMKVGKGGIFVEIPRREWNQDKTIFIRHFIILYLEIFIEIKKNLLKAKVLIRGQSRMNS